MTLQVAPKASQAAAPLRANPQVTSTKLDDGSAVLLHLDSRFYYSLNRTGALLWNALQEGPATADSLVRVLTSELDVDESTASRDVRSFVDELADEGIVL